LQIAHGFSLALVTIGIVQKPEREQKEKIEGEKETCYGQSLKVCDLRGGGILGRDALFWFCLALLIKKGRLPNAIHGEDFAGRTGQAAARTVRAEAHVESLRTILSSGEETLKRTILRPCGFCPEWLTEEAALIRQE
jgi:hypothetical protein